MMCGFDAECVAIVANVRFFLRFFLIIATIVTHLRQNHTPFFTVWVRQLFKSERSQTCKMIVLMSQTSLFISARKIPTTVGAFLGPKQLC